MKRFAIALIVMASLLAGSALAEIITVAPIDGELTIHDGMGDSPKLSASGCGSIKIRPMCLTTIDDNNDPWPWFSVGEIGRGYAYFEIKGTGYFTIKVKIIDAKTGTVVSKYSYGNIWVDTCSLELWYAYYEELCEYPGLYIAKFIFKRLSDGKQWTATTKIRFM